MKNTVENNILLAEFLGWDVNEDGTIELPLELANHWQGESRELDCLVFHKNWNWIMLVVDKVESLGFSVSIHTDTCYVAHNTDKCIETIINISDYKLGKLKVVYNACIQFVKWYNENKH